MSCYFCLPNLQQTIVTVSLPGAGDTKTILPIKWDKDCPSDTLGLVMLDF